MEAAYLVAIAFLAAIAAFFGLLAWSLAASFARERAEWKQERHQYIERLTGVRTDPTPRPKTDRHWTDAKEAAAARKREPDRFEDLRERLRLNEGSEG